jgi:hypothetical protein
MAEHMAAPTNAALVKKPPANAAPSTLALRFVSLSQVTTFHCAPRRSVV